MDEEEGRPHLLAQRPQVLAGPGRTDLAMKPRLRALGIPAQLEAVAVGGRLGNVNDLQLAVRVHRGRALVPGKRGRFPAGYAARTHRGRVRASTARSCRSRSGSTSRARRRPRPPSPPGRRTARRPALHCRRRDLAAAEARHGASRTRPACGELAGRCHRPSPFWASREEVVRAAADLLTRDRWAPARRAAPRPGARRRAAKPVRAAHEPGREGP